MARIDAKPSPLTSAEKERLMALLGAVSSYTLLKVLKDMEGQNVDAGLIIEVLLERAIRDEDVAARQEPVMPR